MRATLGADPSVAARASDLRPRTHDWTEGYVQGSSTNAPARQIGRLFFQIWNPVTAQFRNSWCTATVVSAENRSVVWTAGHCVYETYSNRWNRNYTFCPGYRNGGCPLGRWTPYRQATTAQWQNARCDPYGRCYESEFRYDLGVLKMNTLNGYRIQGWIGSQGIAFNGAGTQYRNAYGYPKNKSNGEYLYVCRGTNGWLENNLWITAPWVVGQAEVRGCRTSTVPPMDEFTR